jgi:hypothetical protein
MAGIAQGGGAAHHPSRAHLRSRVSQRRSPKFQRKAAAFKR